MPELGLEQEKNRLRAEARVRRAGAHALLRDAEGRARIEVGERLATQLLHNVPPPENAAIGGYWAIGDEIDTLALLRRLHNTGHRMSLPVVTGATEPLQFRAWRPDEKLEPGPLGTSHPSAANTQLVPEVVLVPLLAFDGAGHRLGYGGGHYDRTLAHLRAARGVLAIGLAFDEQRFDALPFGPLDQPLDWVVTPSAAHRFP